MDRSMLHGAPPQGSSHRAPPGPSLPVRPPSAAFPPPRGPSNTSSGLNSSRFGPDPRSNRATQPAAPASVPGMALKKRAVKIVTGPRPQQNISAASTITSASLTPLSPSPLPEPVKAHPRSPDGPVLSLRSVPSITELAIATSPLEDLKKDTTSPDKAHKDELENLFNRLMSADKGTAKITASTVSLKDDSEWGPAKVNSFETLHDQATEARIATDVPAGGQQDANSEESYLQKAAEYVNSLPEGKVVTVDNLKVVAAKLKESHMPATSLTTSDLNKLRKRYVFAVSQYLKATSSKMEPQVTVQYIEKSLQSCDKNLLGLYAKLVEDGHLHLDNLDEVAGLCKTVLDVLPPPVAVADLARNHGSGLPLIAEDMVTKLSDTMDGLTAWSTQEKRETSAVYRACNLRGISGLKSIHKVQALVWGGRLESISMPVAGADFAVVRFLAEKDFQTYFQATTNGIELPGSKKGLVFVEKQPGPNSINDVIRNCTEGDASRCVRAMGADDDWTDNQLLRVARGIRKEKREVDCIKDGKTAQGRYYIEFRFANIYHALNFKKEISDDMDWEHCTISYTTDPCESAKGAHAKEDEGTVRVVC